MWKLTYKWACHSHPKKSKGWIVNRYFGRFHKFRNDRWVFGDPSHPYGDHGDTIAYLVKFSWTNIVRHPLVAGRASPDDPDLRDYWAQRRRKVKPPLDSYNTGLLARQDGRCPLTRGSPAHARSATAITARMGTLVAGHDQTGHRRRLSRPPRARRLIGREPDTSRARLLPSQPPGARAQEPVIRAVLAACLSRVQ